MLYTIRFFPVFFLALFAGCSGGWLQQIAGNQEYVEKSFEGSRLVDGVYLGEVYFQKGSSTMGPDGLKEIAAIARSLDMYQIYRSDYHLYFVGFADTKGESKSNLELGVLRARNCALMLEKTGVSLKRARIASYGESRSYLNDTEYKKCEIWLERDPLFWLRSPLFLYGVVFTVFLALGLYLAYQLRRTGFRFK